MSAEEHRKLAQARRILPGHGDPADRPAGQSGHFLQPFRRRIEHGGKRLTKVGYDAAGEDRPHPLYFGSQIAFKPGNAGRTERLVVLDSKLFAVSWVLFKMAGETERSPDFNPSKSPDNRNTTARIPRTSSLDQPNHIAASVVDKEDLLKSTFEILGLGGLIHGGDSIARLGLRSYAFASLRNHSIAIAVPSRRDILGSTPSSVRILVLSGTRRGMSS